MINALSDHGLQLLEILGPNKVTQGILTAAAICEDTESSPTKNLASFIRAANSVKEVLPPKFRTDSEHSFSISFK